MHNNLDGHITKYIQIKKIKFSEKVWYYTWFAI